MSLAKIKADLIVLCIDIQEELPEDLYERVKNIRRQVIESPGWIQKTEHLRIKVLGALFNLESKDYYEKRGSINKAEGLIEDAMTIDTEERSKGVPKPIEQSLGHPSQMDVLEDAINLEYWLDYHGENNIGPSWWMDNKVKDPESWSPAETAWLNKALLKRDGSLLESGKVFRFVGRGQLDRGEWVVIPGGAEYLFGVFSSDNDPKSVFLEDELDISLERWLDTYNEQILPARFMCPVETLVDKRALNKSLKLMNGTVIRGTHVWTYHGNNTYKREGKINLFSCVPL